MNRLGKTALVLVYVLVFLGSIYFFMVALFPSKELGFYISSRVAEFLPNQKLILGNIAITKKLGFQTGPFILTDPKSEMEYLRLKKLEVGLGAESLFLFRPVIVIEAFMGNGHIHGKAQIQQNPRKSLDQINLTVKEIDLSQLNFIDQVSGYKLKGNVNGILELKGISRGSTNIDGKIDLKVREFLISSKNPRFGFSEFDLEQLEILGNISGGVIKIDGSKGKGKDTSLDFSGQIALKEPLNNSEVNLNLNIVSGPKFIERIPKDSPFRAIMEKRLKASNKVNIKITGNLKQYNWQIK